MNRQRKVVITVTYNDLGVIVDTKAEELDSSAQPNLQPTCNNLATDAISRTAALDLIADYDLSMGQVVRGIHALPSAQPEIIHCRDCKHHHYDNSGIPYCDRIDYGYGWKEDDFCSMAERRTDELGDS